jgi:hypothetical protein
MIIRCVPLYLRTTVMTNCTTGYNGTKMSKRYVVIGLSPCTCRKTTNNYQSSLHPRQRRLFSATHRDTRFVVAFKEEEVRIAEHVASLLDAGEMHQNVAYVNNRNKTLFIKKRGILLATAKDPDTSRTPILEHISRTEFDDMPHTRMLGTICVSHVLDEDDDVIFLSCSVRKPNLNNFERCVHHLSREFGGSNIFGGEEDV